MGGMGGGLMGTMATGMAFGAGSAVAHSVVGSMMGGGGRGGGEAPQEGGQQQQQQMQGGAADQQYDYGMDQQ